MQCGFNFFKQFIVLIVIFSFSNLSFAQAKKTAGAKTPTKTATAKKCSGAWTGSVKYTRTQTNEETKTEPRISGMGEDTKISELKYNYKAAVIVSENSQQNGSTKSKANIESKLTGREKTYAKEKVSCDRGKTWKTQSGEFTNETIVEGKDASADANVRVGLNNDGTYNVSVALPQIRGTKEGSYTSSFSGQCKEKKGVNEKTQPEETSVSGNSLISDGSHRIDPKNPNKVSGSFTQNGIAGMEETISWKLQRCGALLMITEVELFQPRHPSITDWVKINNGNYTIDGNFVKVVAKIANLSGEAKNTPIEFRELKEGAILPDGKNSIRIDSGEEKEIVYMWDTSGYAWKESGDLNQSEIARQIEVKITDDSKTENIEVRPKPVIVIPGMWTDKNSFSKFVSYFENMKSAKWKVDYARIYPNRASTENASIVEQKIKEIQEFTNAWHVDLVGHSTGGLAGRVYINNLMGQVADGKPTVTNFIMVGTPNKGTPCASGLSSISEFYFKKSGAVYREITYEHMKDFNKRITAQKGTKFYALVGHGTDKTCQVKTPGDGVVPAGSALWLSKDFIKNHKYTPEASPHDFILGELPNQKVIHQWLAIPPKGNHLPEVENFTGSLMNELPEENFLKRRNYGAMFRSASFEDDIRTTDDEDIEPNFTTGVKLKANESTEIEIPVIDGRRMAITFLAPKNVSATLVESNGTIAGKNLAETPEAARSFRSINVEKPFQKGIWKLKLESRETEDSEVAVVVFMF